MTDDGPAELVHAGRRWRGATTSTTSPRSRSPTSWASAASRSPGCSSRPPARLVRIEIVRRGDSTSTCPRGSRSASGCATRSSSTPPTTTGALRHHLGRAAAELLRGIVTATCSGWPGRATSTPRSRRSDQLPARGRPADRARLPDSTPARWTSSAPRPGSPAAGVRLLRAVRPRHRQRGALRRQPADVEALARAAA